MSTNNTKCPRNGNMYLLYENAWIRFETEPIYKKYLKPNNCVLSRKDGKRYIRHTKIHKNRHNTTYIH